MKELFVTYTKEEVDFLHSLLKEKFDVNISIFKGVDKKEFLKYEYHELKSKQVLKNYDYIWVIDGEIGIIKNNKLIKKIGKNEGYFCEKVKGGSYLIALKDSKIVDFDFEDGSIVSSIILRYVLLKCCG